jgi:hypothetical protein
MGGSHTFRLVVLLPPTDASAAVGAAVLGAVVVDDPPGADMIAFESTEFPVF